MLSRSALAASVRNALRNRTLDSPKLHSKPVPRLVSRAFGQSSHKPNPRPLSSSAALGATAGALGLFLLSTLIPKGSSIQNEPALQLHQKAGATPALPLEKMLSMEEVEKHNALPEDGGQGIWVVIEGNVYDVTEFVHSHPGGASVILRNAGKDVTNIYAPVHPPNAIQDNLDPSACIGAIDPSTIKHVQAAEESAGERKRREARENLPPLGTILCLDDFERVAKSILSEQAWAYYSSAGDDEITMSQNRASFNRVWFRPRILRKIGSVDSSTSLLETSRSEAVRSSLPLYISPAAMAKLGHPDGELNLTRAAGKTGIIQGISANASVSLDEMLDARKEGQAVIYQLYVNKDRAASEKILAKVERKGCNAVFLTVDAPVMGKREKDMRAKGEEVQTGGGHGAGSGGGGVAAAISGYIDPDLSWEDLEWFRKSCKLPLFLKGVQTVEDVELAVKYGVNGVVLSNHGGRSLDFAPPAMDVLIELRQRRPDLFDKIEIYVDGGVRRGTDVLKAVALGAKAVGLGRPFLYAQSGYGEAGVLRAVEILEDEIHRGMRLLGVKSLSELTPDMVDILPRTYYPQPKVDSQ